ncbi:MAG: hypothetical protein A2589_01025 [Candidatus Vogelbacteria bacterium RIFOXYD1_FULL_46_19]|uniref:Uncharacterized protein n=1 Tax=Candidatus Vogelbacteria bacterium RIFOXYD1_FULL_46_19 TaxID=1802439 RepID=A0A1G2QFN9_9BACT|nr:MAG: hypothetical protein A2589_01025 [Candidatus Vogelbacteria bacterium RIFOXYD1_FULL_46_19]
MSTAYKELEQSKTLNQNIDKLSNQIMLSTNSLEDTFRSETNKIIKSNEELSISNNKYASALNWLTLSLVIVTALQVILNIIMR